MPYRSRRSGSFVGRWICLLAFISLARDAAQPVFRVKDINVTTAPYTEWSSFPDNLTNVGGLSTSGLSIPLVGRKFR